MTMPPPNGTAAAPGNTADDNNHGDDDDNDSGGGGAGGGGGVGPARRKKESGGAAAKGRAAAALPPGFAAARAGDLEALRRLVEGDGGEWDPKTAVDKNGSSVLDWVAGEGRIEVCRWVEWRLGGTAVWADRSRDAAADDDDGGAGAPLRGVSTGERPLEGFVTSLVTVACNEAERLYAEGGRRRGCDECRRSATGVRGLTTFGPRVPFFLVSS